FYTPTDHGGLPLADMRTVQHRLVHQLVATGLSQAGYVTVAAIMGLENILDRNEGFTAGFNRERGRDPLLYYVTIFGEPGSDAWAWRFGGHHVSLHYLILNGQIQAVTPSFFGADPAESALLGPHLHRPLATAEDLGRELYRSLGDQRQTALISPVAPTDMATANRVEIAEGDGVIGLPHVWRARFEGALDDLMQTVQANAEKMLGWTEEHDSALRFTKVPKGVAAGDMDDAQQQILSALLDAYLDRLPDALADQQKALVAAEMDAIHFAWAGSDERRQPHYYRIQGRRLLIEYDNTQRDTNHIHTVWRDLDNDFGGDVLAQHYAQSAH
ncbi:MAG: DUF3500 domain-containing protein, partial [Pseudomonadota bacterium]